MYKLNLFTSILTTKIGDKIFYNDILYKVIDVCESIISNESEDDHTHLVITLEEDV